MTSSSLGSIPSVLSAIISSALLLSSHLVDSTGGYGGECISADNTAGKCVPMKSCLTSYLIIKKLTNLGEAGRRNAVQRMAQSQCGSWKGASLVCCPPNEVQMNPDLYTELSGLNCGLGSSRRISHGEVANLFDYRWSALLKYEGSLPFRCGGSLISSRYVLSAAHCYQETPIAVRLGEFDLSTEQDCIKTKRIMKCADPYEDIEIEKYFIPENYVFGGLKDDIVLIRLAREVEFKKHIVPICLPISQELQTLHADWYLVAGWGRTETGNTSEKLLYTSVPHQSLEFCQRSLRIGTRQKLSEGNICAGGNKLYDSCKGDSGGPIFLPSIFTDGVVRSVQFGIVSLGVLSCGSISAPAIYTNVSHYMQWITDHMSLN